MIHDRLDTDLSDSNPGIVQDPVLPRSRCVLLVEDEETVRGIARAVLELEGFAVIVAESGPQALEKLSSCDSCCLMVTDIRMPGMTGFELARFVRQSRPQLPVVFMSGYVGDAIEGYLNEMAESVFLPKPFRLDELRTSVHKALTHLAKAS